MSEPNVVEQVKGALEQYKNDITVQIDDAKKSISDANNEKIEALTAKLTEVEAGLAGIKETQGKGFGVPGLMESLRSGNIQFSWQKFFHAQYLGALYGKGMTAGMPTDKAFDKYAPQEREICKAYADEQNQEMGHAIENLPEASRKQYENDDGSSGGFLVPPEVYKGDIVDAVYAQTPILNMPTLRLPGLRGDIPIPVDNGHLSAYWLGEMEKPQVSQSSFALKWLRAKKLGVFTKISNRLVAFSNYAIEAMIRDKMARDASVKLSEGLTLGTGTESQPQGLMEATNLAAMTDAGNAGTNGGKMIIDYLMKMKMNLATVNELRDTNAYGALMRPEALYGMLRERVGQYATQARGRGMPILPGSLMVDKSIIENAMSLKIGETTQLSATETQGTSTTCSTVVLGDFSKFVYASFRDPIFRVSDVAGDGGTGSAFLEDQLYLVMFMECDSRLLRAASFAKFIGVECSEASWD